MDIATIGGLVLALVLVVVANILAKGNPIQLITSPVPYLLTIFGSLAASMSQYPLQTVIGMPKIISKAFFQSKEKPEEAIEMLVKMVDKARREGLLALEEDSKKIHDAFLRRGVMLVVDGVDPAQVRAILETDIQNMRERHQQGIGFLAAAGGFSPTMGIIGTVMEMIVLMQELDKPERIGTGIANALLVTFWGLAASNLIFLPLSGKLRYNSEEEIAYRHMLVEGILSLQAGENPRVVREKLSGFLPPRARAGAEKSAVAARAGEAGEAGAAQ